MTQAAETSEKAPGLKPNEILLLIRARYEEIQDVGLAITEDANRVSDTIWRNRKNLRIRRKIAAHLNMSYEKLWGEVDPHSGNDAPVMDAAADTTTQPEEMENILHGGAVESMRAGGETQS